MGTGAGKGNPTLHPLHPWFVAMKCKPTLLEFQSVMAGMGLQFEGEWVRKNQVIDLIDSLTGAGLSHRELWALVYDSSRRIPYGYLFPQHPDFERNMSICHATEAWYAIALMCKRHGCLHKWLRLFPLDDQKQLIPCRKTS